jgi:hypothetical protein
MPKIAGIKNRSPETYPVSKGKPALVETQSNVNTTHTVTDVASSIVEAPISFQAPATGSSKAIVMVSGVLSSPSAGGIDVTVNVLVDTDVPSPPGTVVVAVPATDAPVPFSLVFETTAFTPSSMQTIDVQADTSAGTVVAGGVSFVVMVSSV